MGLTQHFSESLVGVDLVFIKVIVIFQVLFLCVFDVPALLLKFNDIMLSSWGCNLITVITITESFVIHHFCLYKIILKLLHVVLFILLFCTFLFTFLS